MQWRVMVAVAVSSLMITACGGEGGGEPTATQTPDTFDPNQLTGMVLAPEDMPDDLRGLSGLFSPGEARDVAFGTTYGDTSLQVQSTVGRYPDPVTRPQLFERLRRALASVIQNERNYTIDGADVAFQYRYIEGTPSAAVLAIKGEFFVMVQLISADGSREAEVFDEEAMRNYVSICLSRIQQYIDDPSSITPVPGAMRYSSPTPSPGTATPIPR